MKKTFLFLFTLLIIFSFASKSVLADGMVIRQDPYSDRWDYSGENNQQAFINYENGLQKMIISIGLDENNSKGVVWLFPVPADPNKVAIDVVKNLPQLKGEEISKKAKMNLDKIRNFLQETQIYTIPIIVSIFGNNLSAGSIGSGNVESVNLIVEVKQDVKIYEHIEKEGITSEIVTAKTANGLFNYLKSKGLKIESGSIPVLDNYIGKEYSFIASWISSSETNISANQRGVFVTFPTKDIYFPLLPTSVYGNKVVPATIKVIGHVSPKVFQNIKSYTKTEYYINSNANFTEGLKNFYSEQNQNIKYTKIEINAPSKLLTDDLWISKQVPVKTYFSTFIASHPIISGIFLLILISLIWGILLGWIFFKGLRKNILKLGLIGLSNCLSFFGLLFTIIFINTKEKTENIDALLFEIKQKGYFWKRKTLLILSLFNVPALLFLTVGMLPVLMESFEYNLILLMLIPILILIFSLIIKKIKTEDKILFNQLEAAGYSSLTFQPKDKMKIIFIPLFSVSFVFISWCIVKFIKLFI